MQNQKLNMKTLAERWQCSRRHIHRLIAAGDLVAIDLTPTGSQRRSAFVFDLEAIERFEQRRATHKVETKRLERRARRTPKNYTEYV